MIRNDDGGFIVGFFARLDFCSIITQAELLGIFNGLAIGASSKSFSNLTPSLRSDLITKAVRQINLLARGREFVSFDRRFREANQSVDAFAKHGLSLYLDFNQVFDFIPHFVYLMLLVDTLCPFL